MSKIDELTPKSLTDEWLVRLNIGGCNPKNPSKTRRLISYFFIFYNCIMVILMTLDSVFVKFESIGHFTEGLIISLGFFQEIIKIITLLTKAKILSEMMDIIWTKFWPISNIEQKTQIQVLKIYKILQIVARGYGYNIVGATIFFVIGAMSTGNRSLPMDIWVPNKEILKQSPYYETVVLLEVVFTITSAMIFLIPIDALFIVTIGVAYCQFIILNEKLIKIGNKTKKEDYRTVKECIAHHNLLLRFLAMIENVYSSAILLTIGSNLFLTTLSMYGIVMESKTSRIITFSGVLAGVFIQLFFYCQTGQLIQDKVESIGEAAYNSNWNNVSDRKIKMSLMLLILRSQRRFNITMGGFMVLNLESFASVVRASFSFLTFLENVKS